MWVVDFCKILFCGYVVGKIVGCVVDIGGVFFVMFEW